MQPGEVAGLRIIDPFDGSPNGNAAELIKADLAAKLGADTADRMQFIEAYTADEDSQDYYLTLQVGRGGETESYRLGLSPSPLYDSDRRRPRSTGLWVEAVYPSIWRQNGVRAVGELAELGERAITKYLKCGDTVVLIPLFAPPDYVREDEQGVKVAGIVVLRRLGGGYYEMGMGAWGRSNVCDDGRSLGQGSMSASISWIL